MSNPADLLGVAVREFKLPASAVQASETPASASWGAARLCHSLPEIDIASLPLNTLVMMRSRCRSTRQRGRVREDASAAPGQLGLLPRGDYGRWQFDEHRDRAQAVLHLFLSADHLARLAEGCGLPPEVELVDRIRLHDPALALLMAEIDRAFDRPVTGRLYMDGLVTAVAARILERHTTRTPAQPRRGGLAPWQVSRTQEAMAASLDADISLDALAEIAGCSPTHFSRAFKQSVGLPPFDWLHERRIERAKQLLEDNRLPLAEVALAVGFAAQPQFTTAFGKATGMTPGRWRRERRG